MGFPGIPKSLGCPHLPYIVEFAYCTRTGTRVCCGFPLKKLLFYLTFGVFVICYKQWGSLRKKFIEAFLKDTRECGETIKSRKSSLSPSAFYPPKPDPMINDFMFKLTWDEVQALRSQNVTLKTGKTYKIYPSRIYGTGYSNALQCIEKRKGYNWMHSET